MSTDLGWQRLYERVELITGVGDARLGKLCIMSFVSLLAGETFGDRPKTASPVIRKFAIPVNDRMDDAERQRLKPFAPRIVGTNDGHDGTRAALLYRAIREEVLPFVGLGPDEAFAFERAERALGARAAHNLRHIANAWREGRREVLAKECGHLLATLSARERDTARRQWYLAKAIDLLDRLCEVGAASRERAGRSDVRRLAN